MFQRTKEGPVEYGIAIARAPMEYDVYVIVDMEGKPVPEPIWNYALQAYEGCFMVKEPA
jgi:hypothetical protein